MFLSQIKTLLYQYDRQQGGSHHLFGHFSDPRDIKRIRAVYEAEVKKGNAQLSADAEVTLFKWLEVYEAEVKKGNAQLSADAEVTLFKWLCLSSCRHGRERCLCSS